MTEFDPTSDYFTAFRKEYSIPNFAREDALYWFKFVGFWGLGIAYITIVLAVTVVIAFLGTRGYSRWRISLQMTISLAIGFGIIICATGVNWQKCDYERNENGHTILYGVHIGTSQANITMAKMENGRYSEYHNLKIGWIEVDQAEKEYQEALMSGWPAEILRLARYVSADMQRMRYMRSFRWSGYAAKIVLWAAFSSWLLANILMGSHVTYSAMFLLLTGGLQLLACTVYGDQTPHDFYIPMDDGTGNTLKLRYDWMFWLTLFMGLFVVLISAIILILDYLRTEDMNKFFGTISEYHSPYEDVLAQNQNKDIKGMIRNLSQKRPRANSKETERSRMPHSNGTDNPNFANSMNSMNSINELDEEERAAGEVPEIQVEMVAFTPDSEEDPEASQEIAIHTDSDSESQNELDSDMTETQFEDVGTIRSTRSTAPLVDE
ncbi:dual oxidase maturation factor 2-like [Watersipora subatra]|uniref:dual oxidase maturation factor 2-like n=1 Tax=Watersipora subatra TaxID=2589382 RepID=UPI00355AF0EC